MLSKLEIWAVLNTNFTLLSGSLLSYFLSVTAAWDRRDQRKEGCGTGRGQRSLGGRPLKGSNRVLGTKDLA